MSEREGLVRVERSAALQRRRVKVPDPKRKSQDRGEVGISLVRFCLVGASGMIVDLTSFSLLVHALPLAVASGLAIWIAMTWNFWLNRWTTFSHVKPQTWWKQYGSFCVGCSLGALINWATRMSLIRFLPLFPNQMLLASVVGVAAGTVFNFTMCRLFVFRPTDSHSNEAA